jgi:hypothetical protein
MLTYQLYARKTVRATVSFAAVGAGCTIALLAIWSKVAFGAPARQPSVEARRSAC